MEPISSNFLRPPFFRQDSSSSMITSEEPYHFTTTMSEEEGGSMTITRSSSTSSTDSHIDEMIRTMSREDSPLSFLSFRGPSVSRHNSEPEELKFMPKRRHSSKSRASQTEHPSENSEESLDYTLKHPEPHAVEILSGPSLLPKQSTIKTKTISSRFYSFIHKIQEKTEKAKVSSCMALIEDKIRKQITPSTLLELPVDPYLTEHLYIMIQTPQDGELCLHLEKLQTFYLTAIALKMTETEQDLLLNFASNETVLKDVWECIQVLKEAAKKQKASQEILMAMHKEELEIAHIPFLFISLNGKAESMKVTYECLVKSKSDSAVFRFTKTTQLFRVREESELLEVEYSLKKIEPSS